jgi:Flp pilus assembly protein CpaB
VHPIRPRRRRAPWRRFTRRRSIHWLLAGLLAVATAWAVGTTVAAAEADRRRWGEDRAVAVAAHPIAPGTVIGGGDVRMERGPAGVVPDGALDALPVGAVAVDPIVAGEAVVATRLAPDGLHGLAALLPPGWRAFAVPSGPGALRVERGDLVDMLATLEPAAAGGTGDEPTVLVAESAEVLAVDEQSVTLAVPADATDDMAFALASATITLALRAP